jgi:hypothetical protein
MQTEMEAPERTNGSFTDRLAELPAIDELDHDVRGWVRERPLLALGMAILAGYAAGRILSRL